MIQWLLLPLMKMLILMSICSVSYQRRCNIVHYSTTAFVWCVLLVLLLFIADVCDLLYCNTSATDDDDELATMSLDIPVIGVIVT